MVKVFQFFSRRSQTSLMQDLVVQYANETNVYFIFGLKMEVLSAFDKKMASRL